MTEKEAMDCRQCGLPTCDHCECCHNQRCKRYQIMCNVALDEAIRQYTSEQHVERFEEEKPWWMFW